MKACRCVRVMPHAALCGVLFALTACGDVLRQDRSASYLAIDSLSAASGARPQSFGNTLESDVLTIVNQTIGGQQVRVPTVFEDFGRMTLRLQLKDIGAPGAAASPTSNNDITVTRYRVVYRRSDGRSAPGVDVPFGFDGAATATVSGTTTTTIDFTLVRVQAKLEAPLKALAGGGSAVAISTIADVTLYGRDHAGHDVSVTGSISVNFADWGDPQS